MNQIFARSIKVDIFRISAMVGVNSAIGELNKLAIKKMDPRPVFEVKSSSLLAAGVAVRVRARNVDAARRAASRLASERFNRTIVFDYNNCTVTEAHG